MNYFIISFIFLIFNTSSIKADDLVDINNAGLALKTSMVEKNIYEIGAIYCRSHVEEKFKYFCDRNLNNPNHYDNFIKTTNNLFSSLEIRKINNQTNCFCHKTTKVNSLKILMHNI